MLQSDNLYAFVSAKASNFTPQGDSAAHRLSVYYVFRLQSVPRFAKGPTRTNSVLRT